MRRVHRGVRSRLFNIRLNRLVLVFLGCFLLAGRVASCMEIEEARSLFLSGRYSECIAAAEAEFKDKPYSEQWRLLLLDGFWTVGRYEEARTIVTNALAQESSSIRMRLRARDIFLSLGETRQAESMVRQISYMVSARPWDYRAAPDLVAIGRTALLLDNDPRQVMDRIYAVAKRVDPSHRDVYLALGDLALEKHDFALAAKTFEEGLTKVPDDPDLHFGMALAYAPSEPALMLASLESVLRRNTNHVGSLLLLADHAIDAENYGEAGKLLERVRKVNPWHPEAWAMEAVIAHLQNEPQREQSALKAAFKYWTNNPAVPHLVGRKLSQKYRFSEGASLQRKALEFDPGHMPAKAQLAQDLLRLGEVQEGWQLAEQVHNKDGYDVHALNLVTLRDTMAKYRALTNRHFIVRMAPHEADLYGARALELLESARERLCRKYNLELNRTIHVEIFPDQRDFAVRTFGMPENHGFLGVCFGPVVTANSPASRPGQRFNWEAVLWHEFTHVITLELTRNKMPRWLSEGISVYEERLANPAWGEHLNPRYREMILDGTLSPVSKLSAAFLAPRSALHLQFAYYQSSLVVQFLVERFSLPKLVAVLGDLREGAEINQALARHTIPMAELDKEFAAYARRAAEQMAPGLEFEKPDLKARLSGQPDAGWADWMRAHPTNFWVMTRQATEFVEAKQWNEAMPILKKLIELFPGFTGPDCPYALLAQSYRAAGETNRERAVLEQWAARDNQAVDAYQRLMELGTASGDWPLVEENARRYLAVNPLVALPYRFMATAAESLGHAPPAIQAYRALLALDPPNPADIHFKLAKWLHREGDLKARRHVLQALEEAPRFSAALRLLLEMNNANPPAQADAATEKTAVPQ